MDDQPAYVTRDEFERRMRVLESEMEGEKAVTRHVLEQGRLNGDDLAAVESELAGVKSQLGHIANDMVVVKAALNSHGNRLNVLTQDVREIRTEMGQMRPEMGEMRTEMGEMRTEMGQMHAETSQMGTKLDTLAQDVAAIRAALAPRNSPAE
jgi:chromosome segregation ATPase